MLSVITKKPQETEYIGQRLATFLAPGDTIVLNGDLGAGKTLFVKGVAKGLGINEEITSPTFTIVQEYYEGRLPLYHFDVYRLNSPKEMNDIGYEEYFYGQGVTFIEWGSLVANILPEEFLTLEFVPVEGGREIFFHPQGSHYERLVEELTGHDYSKHR